VETHQEIVVKFGGHAGAVGLTILTEKFADFRGRLLESGALARAAGNGEHLASTESEDISSLPEAQVALEDLSEIWWLNLSRLSPFGTGHPLPLFQIDGVETISRLKKRRSKLPPKEVVLKSGLVELTAEFEQPIETVLDEAGPWTVIGYPAAVRKDERKFIWKIRNIRRS
jgi:hypothetical protein